VEEKITPGQLFANGGLPARLSTRITLSVFDWEGMYSWLCRISATMFVVLVFGNGAGDNQSKYD
jgi:hypothetical protein